MNDDQDLKLTDLDYLIGNHHLQMMKAALPFMGVSEQKMLSVFVKFNELQRTITLFKDEEVASLGICSMGAPAQKRSLPDMLNAIKPYGNTAEQDMIDLISNFLQGNRLFSSFQGNPGESEPVEAAGFNPGYGPPPPARKSPLEQIKGFLPPEQQSKLETMQLMMQAMQQFT